MKTITEALDLEMVMATPSDGQLWGADDYENGSFTGKRVFRSTDYTNELHTYTTYLAKPRAKSDIL